ncbi:alpha-1,2-fucosyltransferase [Curtobacterium sp. 24E2]|nr:alpha-1,2-fucosyltransferase [Curtobacterium sp. 24E2]
MTSSREDFRLGQPYDWRGRRRSKTRDRSLTTVFSDPETLPSAFRPGTFNIGFFQDAASLALPTDATTALLAAYRNAVSAGSASANRPVLHVRRGDYTTSPAAQRTFGTLSRRYYDDACRALGIPIDESIIFTDDPAAVEREFDVPRSNIIGPEDIESPLDTLVAMSRASALVIPNSTFSWWAAELASHVPVAAPSTWFFDRPGTCGALDGSPCRTHETIRHVPVARVAPGEPGAFLGRLVGGLRRARASSGPRATRSSPSSCSSTRWPRWPRTSQPWVSCSYTGSPAPSDERRGPVRR